MRPHTLIRPLPKLPRFPLVQLLERDHNNLDLIRLVCACLVIFGHAFVIVDDPAYPLGTWDPSRFLHYEGIYSASIAVKVFFFISGLLVTNSLLTNRSVTHYIFSRLFRVGPAFLVVLLFSAFAVGPIFSTLPVRAYFGRVEVYQYLFGNLFMLMPGHLPEVFVDNPLPRLVNGALWSLSYEVAAYFVLLLIGLFGCFRSRALCCVILAAILIDPLLSHPILFHWLGSNPQFIYLPPCFAMGACLALFKDRFTVSPVILLVAIALGIALRQTAAGPLLFFAALFLCLLYISGLSWMRKIKLKSDPSYGTFLWGFLVQQMLAAKFADRGLVFNLLTAIVISVAAGWISWHLVEKPSQRWGSRLLRSLVKKPLTTAGPALAPGQLSP